MFATKTLLSECPRCADDHARKYSTRDIEDEKRKLVDENKKLQDAIAKHEEEKRRAVEEAMKLKTAAHRQAEHLSKLLRIKMTIVGDTSVGKSCLVACMINESKESFQMHENRTIEAAFNHLPPRATLNGIKADVQVWDTAGQARYDILKPMYLRGSNLVYVVFALNTRDSLERAEYFIQVAKRAAREDATVVLVGNKSDDMANRCISYDEGLKLQRETGIDFYFEVSARTRENLEESFQTVLDHLIDKHGYKLQKEQSSGVVIAPPPPGQVKSSCC
jgi:small GTP-binding protein